MTMKMHEAIYWKKNNAPGISIVGDEIRDWPEALGKKPDAATIATWEAEYAVHEAGIKAAEDKRQADIVAAKEAIQTISADVDKANDLDSLKAVVLKLAEQVKVLAG